MFDTKAARAMQVINCAAWWSSCAARAHGDDARVAVLVWDARAAPRERLCALTMGHARTLSAGGTGPGRAAAAGRGQQVVWQVV